jgi:hypothetical protein
MIFLSSALRLGDKLTHYINQKVLFIQKNVFPLDEQLLKEIQN